MDPDPDRNVGCIDLSGESDFHPAAPVIVAIPAVTHPGAGPSSAMVTRSRARGGREINVEPEVEFRPEIEFLPEKEIPAETDEEVSGATRHLTDIASQYTPEVTLTQEVRTSASITTSRLPTIPRSTTPHSSVDQLDAGRRPLSQHTYLYAVPLCPIHYVDPFLNQIKIKISKSTVNSTLLRLTVNNMSAFQLYRNIVVI